MIIANGMMLASYEETNINHPIRRLLHQFCYKTLAINYSATKYLLPVNNLAFRIWGFTEESWAEYFSDIFFFVRVTHIPTNSFQFSFLTILKTVFQYLKQIDNFLYLGLLMI